MVGYTGSHIPSPGNHDSLSIHIREPWTGNAHNRPCRFLRARWPTQRNIGILLSGGLCRVSSTALARCQLLSRNAQRDFRAVRCGDEGTRLFRGGQSGRNVAKGNRVGAHAECWTPFFGNGFGKSNNTGFGEGVVGLASKFKYISVSIDVLNETEKDKHDVRVSMNTARAADVDNHPWFLILDAEVWRCSSHEFERRRVVNSQHGIPLLVGHLKYSLRKKKAPSRLRGYSLRIVRNPPCE